jgi:transposase
VDLALAGHSSYISEPMRGRQDWEGEALERDAVYANRRRKKGERGQRLMRRRGEMLERSFAHVLETGGMRRTHLRFHYNIAKRMLIHVAGFNLGLLMRKRFDISRPRGPLGRVVAAIAAFVALVDLICGPARRAWLPALRGSDGVHRIALAHARPAGGVSETPFTTGC